MSKWKLCPSGTRRLLALGDFHVAPNHRAGSQEGFSGRKGKKTSFHSGIFLNKEDKIYVCNCSKPPPPKPALQKFCWIRNLPLSWCLKWNLVAACPVWAQAMLELLYFRELSFPNDPFRKSITPNFICINFGVL